MLPPVEMLQETEEPQFTGTHNRDLPQFVIIQRKALQSCNASKAEVRSWIEDRSEEVSPD